MIEGAIIDRMMTDDTEFGDPLFPEDFIPDTEDITDFREDEYFPDESMDGDHASGLASAGFGTDEDYFHFDDFDHDY